MKAKAHADIKCEGGRRINLRIHGRMTQQTTRKITFGGAATPAPRQPIDGGGDNKQVYLSTGYFFPKRIMWMSNDENLRAWHSLKVIVIWNTPILLKHQQFFQVPE